MNTILSRLDFLLILVYFIVLLIIGFVSSKRESKEDFLIAERKLGSLSTMATINASKTGSVLMIFVTLVYLWGIAALWYFIGMVLGVLVFLPFALRLKENSQHRFYTLADYFKHNYGKKAAVFASLITIIIMFSFLILNLIAGTKIFVFFTSWPFWLCAIIMILIVMVYLLLGGFKAVVKTDILQYIAMVFILVMLALTLFNGSLIPIAEWNFFKADIATMAGFFIVGILFPFAMPDMWRRVYSARDKKAVRNGILSSAAIYAVFAFLLALVALTVKTKFPAVDPELALIHGFGNLLPAGLLGLSVVLLFSAIMSSIDTYIFTASSAIIQDFLKLDKTKTIEYIRKTIFVLSILAVLITILIQSLTIGTYIVVSFIVVLAIATIATWINKKIKKTTLLSEFIFGLIGMMIFLVISLSKGYIQPTIVLVALASSLLGLIIGAVISLFKKS
ncbi:MAG: hypothetical protein V3V78_05040 [Candidatus Woesearchaeota archaeon]